MRSLDDIATLTQFVKNLRVGIYITASSGEIVDSNQAFVDIFGVESLAELRRLSITSLFADPHRREEEQRLLECEGTVRDFEFEIRRPDGERRFVLDTAYQVQDPASGEILYHGILVDITERKHIEEELRLTKERYDFATSVGKVGTWDWNPATGALIWSDETFRLMGFAPGAVAPTYELYLSLVHPEDREALSSAVQAALQEKKPYDMDCRIILRDGKNLVCHVTGSVEFDADSKPVRMLGTIQDITERKLMEQRLHEKVVRDALTGCYNRHYLAEIVRQFDSRSETWGVIVADVDHFKQCNDIHGHDYGDRVLVQIGRFLTQEVRAEDPVFRTGGDEFVVLLPGLDQASTQEIAERFHTKGASAAPASFSLGWAVREGKEPVERTISRADQRLISIRVQERKIRPRHTP